MIALLVIDMQVGLFIDETPRYDADNVIKRINALGKAVRKNCGIVIFIQYDGPGGEPFEPGSDEWQILPSIERYTDDIIINKTACDSFYMTELKTVLNKKNINKLIITGCATDYCVDTTVRAAISHDYKVSVAADAHTTANRPQIDAATLIHHHNCLWPNLIHPKISVKVKQTADLIAQLNKESS